ncbi:FecR family protein [Nitrobacter sp.]|uniref:FecR family protein n=1 Tax=unclassified Nitrobacter TaxID=2620411 RepID=UPI00321FA80A
MLNPAMEHGDKTSILDEAAEWYIRRDGGTLSATERAEFERWMSDPANRAAYAEIDATWREVAALPRPDIASARISPSKRSLWRGVRQQALAAAAAVLVIFGAGYSLDLPMRLQADAYTATGETRTVTLSDGSSAVLNTASAIAIDYSPGVRRIRLLRGEALFTVAKDASRPFLVDADAGEARALGTAFAVRREDEGVSVTVLESRVGVSYLAGRSPVVELSPGETVRYSSAGVGSVRSVDAGAETAWQRGKLIFVDKPLGEVIAELNRYHSGRIQITDSSIGSHPVSGVFDMRNPVGVLDAIEGALGLHSTRLTNLLILLHR